MNEIGRDKRGRPVPPVLPDEALEILQSAVGYCQRAGLHVKYASRDRVLTLAVIGAAVDLQGGEAHFVLLPPTEINQA